MWKEKEWGWVWEIQRDQEGGTEAALGISRLLKAQRDASDSIAQPFPVYAFSVIRDSFQLPG